MTNRSMRTFVAGHRGMVGSAIVRRLQELGDAEIVTRGREELDLLDQSAVRAFFSAERIDTVYLAAARVGGIDANRTAPADFLVENLVIETNVIRAAHDSGADRLMLLGSSCIYPKYAEQPIREESLLTGALEPTNDGYAVAKIAGVMLCDTHHRQYGRDYRAVMPTNLYGPGDGYHRTASHVIPGLIRRLHEATVSGAVETAIWGSGTPRREFLHVDDLARATVLAMRTTRAEYDAVTGGLAHVNVGSGSDLPISELARLIADLVGYDGRLVFDPSMPDGTPRKLLDSSRITALGWQPAIPLEDGLRDAYADFLSRHGSPQRTMQGAT